MADIEVGQNRSTLTDIAASKRATPAAVAAGFKDAKDALEGNKGTLTATGNAVLTAFTVTHGLEKAPTNIQLTPLTAAAAATHWVSARTATEFIVTFGAAPAAAAENVKIDWVAYI